MARPIWRGSLSFGLVAIPVQLHTAVRENRPKFRLLHAKDKSPIKYERVCVRDGTPVAWEDLVKGYEYEKGRFVVLTKEDFKAAAIEKDRRVQVTDFVPAEDIDDRYFDQPYYLLPDKSGEHAYAVFRAALAETGRVGIGKVVLRERQHLVAIESIEEHLVLTMLRFEQEIVDAPDTATLKRVKVPPRELKLATDLIGALAARLEARPIRGRLPGESPEGDQAQAEGRDDYARRREPADACRSRRSGRAAEGESRGRGKGGRPCHHSAGGEVAQACSRRKKRRKTAA